MPTLSLRWFLVVVAVFLLAGGADLYLSHNATAAKNTTEGRIDVTDFMTAARAGELTHGEILFRANATGLADLTASRKTEAGASAFVRTTARLTDRDLAVLREHRFVENDAAA